MNWLAWRQHRKQFMVGGIFLILFAALVIPTGLHFWHTYQYALSTCGKSDSCSQLNTELFQSNLDLNLTSFITIGMLFMPILLGLFWGVPFLAKEYNDGTNKLVWTQGVSRRKWLSVKLVWILLGAVILATAFALLNTWWFRPFNTLSLDRFGPAKFETQGIVPIAYAFFAVSLGVALGAWFKRIMIALGTTLVLLIALVLIVVPNFVRPYYQKAATYKTSLTSDVGFNGPPGSINLYPNSLVISNNVVNSNGQSLNWSNPPSKCIVTQLPNGNPIIPSGHTTAIKATQTSDGQVKPIVSQNGGPPISLDCLGSLGYSRVIKYQPGYRYWDFQRIEAASYLVLSLIPLGATYWLVIRRDA